MAKRYYVTGDGKKYPLIEAQTPFSITIYRKDCKKAIIGDPSGCLIALGARRHRNVEAAYIGSSQDAYLIMRFGGRNPRLVAVHYIINAKAARLRDAFDTDESIKTQEITLLAVTPGMTLAHRAKLNKARKVEIKNGAEVKKRGTPNTTRVMRIGVPHRPHARIEHNSITVPAKYDQ